MTKNVGYAYIRGMLKIIERAAKEAGGLGELAKGLGITHNSFYSWQRVPAARVLEIERLTGISRHELRPDLYPAPTPAHMDAAS